MIVSSHLLNAVLQLIIVIPFVLLARRKFTKEEKRFLAISAIIFLLWSILNSGLSEVIIFEGQQWNWAGKVSAFILSIYFIYRNKRISTKELGWTFKFNPGSFGPVVILLLAALLIRGIVYVTLQTPSLSFHTETLVFQGLAAALSDEIIFRGILLALLNRIFVSNEDIFGFKLGWPVLISAVLYGLSQGFILQEGLHLQIHLTRILVAFFIGLIAALLKERSGSLLPAFVFHALWNLIGNH